MKRNRKKQEVPREPSFLETCLKEYGKLLNGEVIGTIASEGWDWDVIHGSGIYGLRRIHNSETSIIYSLDKSAKWRMKAEYYNSAGNPAGPRIVPRGTEFSYHVSSELSKIISAYDAVRKGVGTPEANGAAFDPNRNPYAACAR